MRQRALLLASAVAVILLPQIAEACPVCFGDIGGPAARGVNNGILAMLGVVFTVQIGFAVMFVGMVRRAKQLPENSDALENRESTDVTKRGSR